MHFLIEEYGDIIISVICLTLAVTLIVMCLSKCSSIEASLLGSLFYH